MYNTANKILMNIKEGSRNLYEVEITKYMNVNAQKVKIELNNQTKLLIYLG